METFFFFFTASSLEGELPEAGPGPQPQGQKECRCLGLPGVWPTGALGSALTMLSPRKLMSIAFNDMNPFPMKQLRQLRTAHGERLEAELQELEQLKAAYLETQASRLPAVPEACASEDELDGEA